MMKRMACAWLIGLGIVSSAIGMEEVKPIDKLPLDEGEISFVIEDGEATVNEELIKRISVGRDKVTASYRNKGKAAKRPRYTIRLYNQYGFLLGEDTVGNSISFFGGVGNIEPDDVATEDLTIEWLPLDRIMEKSKVRLPDDWQSVKWVVISESNTMSNKAVDSDKK